MNKVSISSQVIMMFIPIIDLWAFYRIQKLQKFVIFMIMPVIVVGIIGYELINEEISRVNDLISSDKSLPDPNELLPTIPESPLLSVFIAIEIGLIGTRVYFIIIWSMKWNSQN